MNQTAILLILDPRSFALANSAAKALAAALKAKTEVDLADSQRQPMGTLLGTLPILQPIPVATTEGHGFLMALRAIFDTSEDFNWLSSPSYWLAALHGTTFGVLQPCVSVGVNTEPGVGPQFAMPLLLLPPQPAAMTASAAATSTVAALRTLTRASCPFALRSNV